MFIRLILCNHTHTRAVVNEIMLASGGSQHKQMHPLRERLMLFETRALQSRPPYTAVICAFQAQSPSKVERIRFLEPPYLKVKLIVKSRRCGKAQKRMGH